MYEDNITNYWNEEHIVGCAVNFQTESPLFLESAGLYHCPDKEFARNPKWREDNNTPPKREEEEMKHELDHL